MDVLRHIIKNVSERLVQLIESPTPSHEGFFSERQKTDLEFEKMEGSDGTCEDTEDATMLVQIEEAK